MTATERALELVRTAAQAASDKLAENIMAFDVSDQLVITDAFLLASAPNDRQVKAIVDEIEDRLREIGAKPLRRERPSRPRYLRPPAPGHHSPHLPPSSRDRPSAPRERAGPSDRGLTPNGPHRGRAL